MIGGSIAASIAATLFATGWIFGSLDVPLLLRIVVTLVSCAVLPPKLLDCHISTKYWLHQSVDQWVLYMLNPFILVYRAHLKDPSGNRSEDLSLFFKGSFEMALGAAILVLAFSCDCSYFGFWIEHTIKAAGAYLLIFDGMFVLATAIMRVTTGRSLLFSDSPVLAATPAEFWRRYNRDAGRFLYQDVIVPILGKQSPILGIMLVFMLNGILHEYLVCILSRQFSGYLLMFFGVQGIATASTFWWKPRGRVRIIATLATTLFNLLTSAIFFTSIDTFCRWYDSPSPFAILQ